MIKNCDKCKKEYEMHDGSNVCPDCGERTFIAATEKKPTVWTDGPKTGPTVWKDVNETKTSQTVWHDEPKAPPTKWTEE